MKFYKTIEPLQLQAKRPGATAEIREKIHATKVPNSGKR
jgi:hypothetical protein